jgi:hypothetical protein
VGFAVFKVVWGRLLEEKKILRLLQFSFPVIIKLMLFFHLISAHLCDRSEELTGYNDLCPQLHFHL